MILPGISGGYLLLILGQYIPILGAIDSVKSGLELRDWSRVIEAMHVVVPVGIGVLIGVVGVSNLIKLLLERHRKPTLGVLLGLLLGAVLGLWPFQQPVAPEPGSVVKGRVMTPELIAELSAEDYPLHRFAPTGGQMSASAALVAGGLLLTYAISRIGGLEEETER